MKHLPIRELTLCALFCALTALGAFLTIPLPYGQITLQWLFTVLTGFVLAPRAALFSQIAYLLLGLMGAPVFSGFSGGISAILSPTFGFVPGMVICAPLVSLLLRALTPHLRFSRAALLSGLVGLAITYLCGALWGWGFLRIALSQSVSPLYLMWNWCLIYLPLDLLKLAAALTFAPALRRFSAKI